MLYLFNKNNKENQTHRNRIDGWLPEAACRGWAKEVKVLAVGDKTIIADYFVIANGNTSTHVRSLADEVEFKIGEAGIEPTRHEGRQGNSWRTVDYSCVVVHVFDREAREFYKLDKLYTDFE